MWSEAIHTVLSPTPPWVPRPGFGPEAGLGADWGHTLDTLVHAVQGVGHYCSHPLEDQGRGPASSQAPGGLTTPFSQSAVPPGGEHGSRLRSLEPCCYDLRAKAAPVLLGAVLGWVCLRTSLPPSLPARPTALQADQAHGWQPSCTSHLSETWRMHLPGWSRHGGL